MSWEFACTLDDLRSGEMKRVNIANVDVLIVRHEDGVAAIPPSCPHLEEPLENGMCDGKILTCMKHLWQWEVDSGAPIGLAEAPLKMYETKVEDEAVYVFVSEELSYEHEA